MGLNFLKNGIMYTESQILTIEGCGASSFQGSSHRPMQEHGTCKAHHGRLPFDRRLFGVSRLVLDRVVCRLYTDPMGEESAVRVSNGSEFGANSQPYNPKS